MHEHGGGYSLSNVLQKKRRGMVESVDNYLETHKKRTNSNQGWFFDENTVKLAAVQQAKRQIATLNDGIFYQDLLGWMELHKTTIHSPSALHHPLLQIAAVMVSIFFCHHFLTLHPDLV